MAAILALLYFGLVLVVPQAFAANTSCSDPWMFIDIHYRYGNPLPPMRSLLIPSPALSMLVQIPSPTDYSLE